MGVFGPGIFADDDALDVRSEYRFLLAEAQSDEKATDAIARDERDRRTVTTLRADWITR